MAVPALSGNVSTDMSSLNSMVSATGTNGNDLADFAAAVAKEATASGNSLDASVASNISNSLSNGSYNQQGSEVAITNAASGKSTDSIQVNSDAIKTELQNGDFGDAVNNLNALSKEMPTDSLGQSQFSKAAGVLSSAASSGDAIGLHVVTSEITNDLATDTKNVTTVTPHLTEGTVIPNTATASASASAAGIAANSVRLSPAALSAKMAQAKFSSELSSYAAVADPTVTTAPGFTPVSSAQLIADGKSAASLETAIGNTGLATTDTNIVNSKVNGTFDAKTAVLALSGLPSS